MAREFSAESLVVIPRVNVDSGLVMWQAIRACVMAEKKLPPFLTPAWHNVDAAGSELAQKAQLRLLDSSQKTPAEKRKADQVVDNAVGALDQFLGAWARLPDSVPEAQLAASVQQTLFPEGTAFLKLPMNEEWAQIERRLALVKSEGLDKDIAKLGGTPFVTHLVAAHVTYGKVLGLTTPQQAQAEAVPLKEPLAALTSALRVFVIKVAAYADPADPTTQALAERLLRPLTDWQEKRPKLAPEEEESPPNPTPNPKVG